jgi:Asp-tRNA(Asn)/Glu-tRNA(Gln) amidotransferase A subunit family amidase
VSTLSAKDTMSVRNSGNNPKVPWPASAALMLSHVGPIARNVADAALVLGVVAGPERRDPFSLMEPMGPEPEPQTLRSLRVAFSPTLGYAKVDAPVQRVVAAAVEKLRRVFPTLDTVAEAGPDPIVFHRALFFGGINARLGDLLRWAERSTGGGNGIGRGHSKRVVGIRGTSFPPMNLPNVPRNVIA